MLIEWNDRVNLVSRRSADTVLEHQLLPSLGTLRIVPPGGHPRVLDVGSGGGFPGLPLAILRPQAEVHLLEATRKKCGFLKEVVRALALDNARVHWGRIEEPPPALLSRAPFDAAVARAVGHPDKIAAAAAKLLAPGGALWTFRAPGTGADEILWPPEGPVTALAPSRAE